MSQQLADLLFPNVTQTIDDLRKQYPARPAGQQITRFAPSPTWFLHIWGVYSAYVSERFAHQGWKHGVFFLRIEDTDQKRQIEWWIDLIIQWLKWFGIQIDEGPLGDNNTDVGSYGPYIQSHRKDLYTVFVKHAVAQWFAYPCWMSEADIEATRTMQQAAKKIPGIYGQYAKRRDASWEDQKQMIESGSPFVIRRRASAQPTDKVVVKDLIKWTVEMQDNFLDNVLLKSSDWLPTYHMAHLVDDYLMWTTHVIRADEWFPSLPFHMQLFSVFGFTVPQYCHISPLLKLDVVSGNKRKLSKRHDPEADIQYFFKQGIPTDAILEFLTNIVDPFYEEWQKNNLDKTYKDYEFDISHMNQAGALLDMMKLAFVSKEWLARLDKEEFVKRAIAWADMYGADMWWIPYEGISETLVELMKKYPDYTFAALNIERQTAADPKRYRMFSDILTQLPTFYDEVWTVVSKNLPVLPEACTPANMNAFLADYEKHFNVDVSKDEWFTEFKNIWAKHGFAASNADFKNGGYIGKIGDLAMFFRIKLLCSPTTPDLYESMKVMWKDRVFQRLRG